MLIIADKLNFNVDTANEYDRGIRRTLPTYNVLFRLVQAYFRKHLEEDSEILIVGAGGGNELVLLGSQNPTWTFTAVDPAPAMLTLARNKANEYQLSDRVNFIEGTIGHVNPPQLYDAATLILVLHFIQDDADKLEQLTLIRERLKSEASFVLVTMYGDAESTEFEELISLWKAYWLDTTSLAEAEVNQMEKTVRNLSFISEDKLLTMLKEAGFTNIVKFFQTNMFGGWICSAN